MANYFANGSRFRPHKNDADAPVLESITGTLVSWDTRHGNSSSGKWLVIRIKKDDDYINCFFDTDSFIDADYDLLDRLKNRTITVSSEKSSPVINSINVKSEGSIRERLLEGVAAGRVNKDDLPALLEFAKGNNELFEKWNLFQKQLETENLEKRKEDFAILASDYQEAIEEDNQKISKLKEILKSVESELERVFAEIQSDLVFLQGDDWPEGFHHYLPHLPTSKNLIRIGERYHQIADAFDKFKTQKGVYVICDGKIHLINYAYLEEKGRAFLIGESKEYLRTKPEKVRQIVDDIYEVLFGKKSSTNSDNL